MKNLVNFPINAKISWFVAGMIFIKIFLSLFLALTNLEINDFLIFGIDTFSRLVSLLAILYFINFLNKVSGTRALNIPLFLWFLLAFFVLTAETYYYVTEAPYSDYYAIVGALYLLVEIFLIIKISILPSVPYKKYLIWLGIFMSALVIASIANPFLKVYLLQQYGMVEFQDKNETIKLIHGCLHQVPFLVLAILSLVYIMDSKSQGKARVASVADL